MFDYNTTTGEIWLFDAIGPRWAGLIDFAQFNEGLSAMGGKDTVLRISSPGGSVFEAAKMVAAIERYSGRVVAEIDALAASAATHIMLAADEVRCRSNSQFMLHRASVITWGNVKDHESSIDLLRGADANQLAYYSDKTGKSVEELESLIDSKPEVWLTASEALDLGLVDEILPRKAATKAEIPEGMYAHAPTDLVAIRGIPKAPRRDIAAMRLKLRRS